MKKLVLTAFLSAALTAALTAQVNITIELNTATIDMIDPGGLYIAGGSGFGSPGDNELTDPDGDGIYSITLQREVGFSSFYTFTNGNCGDYSCKENIAGLPCSDPANFNDRFLPPVSADTTILACFGTCDSDGSCTIVTDSIDITFHLNTENIEMIDPSGIFLAGGNNFGFPGDNPMIDPDGDGIYTITMRRPMGFASYYTFTNGACGDWSCKENLEGLPCGDPDSFNDRFLPATQSDTTIMACFGNCASDGSCQVTSTNGVTVDKTLFELYPTLAAGFTQLAFSEQAASMEKNVQVVSVAGQVMETLNTAHQAFYQINTTDYATGLYYVRVNTATATYTRKFIVQR